MRIFLSGLMGAGKSTVAKALVGLAVARIAISASEGGRNRPARGRRAAPPLTRPVTIGSADALSAAPVRGVLNQPCSARAHVAAVAVGDPYVGEESFR